MFSIVKQALTVIILLTILPFQGIAQTSGEVTTFILVRHAEKVDDSRDPELSQEGRERVQKLDELLSKIDFDAVYSTPFIRTRQTALPVAARNDIEIAEYDHRTPEETVQEWQRLHSGETVLISGHSNSTPVFANTILGREHFPDKFEESDYGNLLIISIAGNGEAKLLHLRY